MMTPQTLAAVLRNQAWSRAKGELEATLVTYYSEGDLKRYARTSQLADSFKKFIASVEDSGILEE